MRQVQRRGRRRAKAVISAVAQHTDDFDVAGILWRMSESPAYWILARKEFFRRCFIDDGTLRRSAIVAISEATSGDHRDSHRRKVVRRYDDSTDVVALLHVTA